MNVGNTGIRERTRVKAMAFEQTPGSGSPHRHRRDDGRKLNPSSWWAFILLNTHVLKCAAEVPGKLYRRWRHVLDVLRGG
ncbi:protein sidekick-1-like [Arapaima gigas]